MRSTARRLCKQLHIKVRPTNEKCGPMQTHAINVIANLIEMHDLDNMVLTLRVITETTPANQSQLNRIVITAVNDVCRIRRFTDLGLPFLEAFDAIDLGALHTVAKEDPLSKIYNARRVLSGMLLCRLYKILEPLVTKPAPKPARVCRLPKPPASVARIAMIEKRIEIGLQLIELKAKARRNNNDYSAMRKKHFGDVDPVLATEATRVARMYGQCPEVYRRASWRALVELSSPSLSTSARQRFEAVIRAGKNIKGPQIACARGRRCGARQGAPVMREAA
jgi:hypothetical protein